MSRIQIVSYSEVDTYRQCPHKHQLGYVERWTRPNREGGALARGTQWHAVLEARYKAIMSYQRMSRLVQQDTDPATLIKENVEVVFRQMEQAEFGEIDLIQWMYAGYEECYGLDSAWEVLAVEHNAVVPLFTPEGKRTRFRLKVKIDLIVRDKSGKVWVVDHKSCANLPKQKDLDFDEQFGLYTLAMRKIGKPVWGSIYSAARTQRNKTPGQTIESRFSRDLLVRTERELDTIGRETLESVQAAYSARNRGERHPNTDTCNWKCDFTEACLLGRKTSDVRERQFLGDIGFVQDYTRH